MPSIISQIRQHPDFIQEVKEQIAAKLIDRQGTGYHSRDGLIPGRVTAYEMLSELEFGDPDGINLEWSFNFRVTGEATVQCKTGDGSEFDDSIDGPCYGIV